MSIWKQLIVLGLLAAAGLGAYQAWHMYLDPSDAGQPQHAAQPVTVELAVVETRTLRRTVEAVGTTRARQSVAVVPQASGRIIEQTIRPGAQVSRDEVLVRLDSAIERADLSEAEARVTEARQTLERITQLRQTNAVSQATLENATARLAEARAQQSRARRRLEDRVIRAPFDGVVGLTDYDPGARVTAGDMLARLDDLSAVVVEFSLPETLFARISAGQTIEATSAAFGDRIFTGSIIEVDSRIDPVSRAFRTRALVPNPDSTLPAGMFMSLTLTLSQARALVVPEEAIIFQAAETYVFEARDGTAHRQRVTTGQRRDGVVAVSDGLAEGQRVIIRGLQRVRDGSPIRDAAADAAAPPGHEDAT